MVQRTKSCTTIVELVANNALSLIQTHKSMHSGPVSILCLVQGEQTSQANKELIIESAANTWF